MELLLEGVHPDIVGRKQESLPLPELFTVPSPFRSLSAPPSEIRRVRALDVGAGVGHVTSDALLPLVSDVVLLEPSVTFFKGALQAFNLAAPGTSLYHVYYLPPDGDEDTELKFDFLQRSKMALRDARSLIEVKENLCRELNELVTFFDEQDSTFTRSDFVLKNIFRDAGLKIIREKNQHRLPKGLYPVNMYALREE
ncbi:AdoMet dependent proline di-methyltransferase-domain-containing protein [Suillus lakei]|nr:AdoMet dependent proline di-methyltransferase-domain-containing protein [Suillus lakei]